MRRKIRYMIPILALQKSKVTIMLKEKYTYKKNKVDEHRYTYL